MIEFDGIQHFKSSEFFGGEKSFKQLKIRDEIKNQYCLDNDIDLVRIPYKKIKTIEEELLKILSKIL